VKFLTDDELRAGLDHIRRAPANPGVLELIVRRPAVGEREVLEEGALTLDEGLAGDTWRRRSSSRTADGSPHPDMQLNVMNARVAALIAREKAQWPVSGDQLFIDMDLSKENLPAGTCLALGSAVIEVTSQPHLGCGKFAARFGPDALHLVNSAEGRALCLRGINARVVKAGVIRIGDRVTKLDVVLREATPDDAPVLVELMHQAFEEYRGTLDPPSGVHRESIDSVIEKLSHGRALLATLDGLDVGCVFARPDDGHIYFSRLSVLPGHRQRGIGRRLVERVEQDAREAGFASVWLGVRLSLPHLRDRYQRLGYKDIRYVTHDGYRDPTYVLMEKRLEAIQ
jgi:ribosomal protein S18 acetylase RimI-like enzyme